MVIDLFASNGIPGHEMLEALIDAFPDGQYFDLGVVVEGEEFSLGSSDGRYAMMEKLTALTRAHVSVLIPDEIQCDMDSVRARLEETLTIMERDLAGLKEAVRNTVPR